MTLLPDLTVACALSVDAAVCAAVLSRTRALSPRPMIAAAQVGGTFGGCQWFMARIGAYGGNRAADWVSGYDHWLAFCLLTLAAISLGRGGGQRPAVRAGTVILMLGALGLATSLDALAVGFSAGVIRAPHPGLTAVIIGAVCATLSAAVYLLGRPAAAGLRGERLYNAAGAAVLIGIGLTILHAHGVF